ncbi:MAG: S9 family peptidase [Cyclobacteriaceae bacterium]|jgi:oligopeptidase B
MTKFTINACVLALTTGVLFSCAPKDKSMKLPDVQPPVAAIQPFELVSKDGHKRVDNYYWLKNREDSAVVNYLKAENKYLDTMLAHMRPLQTRLFEEMKARIKEDDSSVPARIDEYFYYTRYVEGGEYPIFCRRKGSMEAAEEIVADGNAIGKGQSFLNLFTSASPDHQTVAVIMDTVGRNFYTVKFKDMKTGQYLPDQIADTRGGYVWTNDNKSILYAVPDKQTLRNYLIKRHILGTPATSDEVIYEEKDQTLDVGISKTRSKKYFIISSGRTDASFAQYLSADKPGKPALVQPLQNDVQYSVNHTGGDQFYVYTNLNAKNYRLVQAPVANPSSQNWTDVIAHREDVFLQDVAYFRDYLALAEMNVGLVKIRVIKSADKSENYVSFDEPAYYAGLGNNPEFNSNQLRYNYQSMTTPSSTFDYNMDTQARELKKETPVLGGFNKANYATERIMVKSRDGKEIPLSIAYRKDKFKKDGTNPGWIYAYGSYGYSMYAFFGRDEISLLDRGFVFAIAHVRGGQEMGGAWYEDGKMLNKKNTFNDFIDCSEWLTQNQYVAKDQLFAEGGSAGGLLMGAITNLRPDLYRGVVAHVPFVDVITTMMDETIPLTTFEWLEWGNPNVKEQYDYMLSYSPYDNVEKKAYPNLLVTTGLHDSQVQYWEPAKWVAKLRVMKTDKNRLYLHTNMDAGHGGASGRFRELKETALKYAFALDVLGRGQ